MNFRKQILVVFLLTLSALSTLGQKSPASETDLKKQAEKNFQSENYTAATPMYSQLLSLYPREAVYNYRYGVCLLLSGQDKSGAASYLETAAKSEGTEPDVHFYLGRSYMYSGQYDASIAEFNQFKKTASAARQTKLQPDVYIRNCEHADQLRKDRKNVAVLGRNKVAREGFFASYDFTNTAGKMLTTPERFLTPLDKEKMKNPVMFMAKNGETIYYASYGKKGDQGRDIYRIDKNFDGTWGEPVSLGGMVNTPEDEDYPYLDKDGRSLYFCSKGHNSMGGYDIFKTKKDNNTGQWSDPQNIGIPINTVDDDIFFVPSTTGETAVYATAVDCESGRIELRNIRLSDVVSHFAIISGNYFSQDQVTRRDARITVIRDSDNGVVTSVKTDRTGEYELVIPAGDSYSLLVEGGSYLPHVEKFYVPGGKTLQGLRQKVVMNKSVDTEEMTLSNFFEPSAADPAVASLDKATQVTRSEFDLKDTVLTKMQAITLDGRTLYAVPPSAASLNALAKLEQPVVKSASQTQPGKEIPKAASDLEKTEPAEEEEMNPAAVDRSQEEVTFANDTIEDEINGKQKIQPVISEKASNAELVKMAFDDAQSIHEEATALRNDASAAREDARSLDSLSKVQLKHANELLASGQKEESQQLFNESQGNALDAIQKSKDASAMDAEAGEREEEYISAIAEAKGLMKSLRVDTNALAYQEIRKRDEAGMPASPLEDGMAPEENSVQIKSADLAVRAAYHRQRSDSLSAESVRLLAESSDMLKRSEKTGDLMMRSYYEKRSKELKASSEARKEEADRELAFADHPETSPEMSRNSEDSTVTTDLTGKGNQPPAKSQSAGSDEPLAEIKDADRSIENTSTTPVENPVDSKTSGATESSMGMTPKEKDLSGNGEKAPDAKAGMARVQNEELTYGSEVTQVNPVALQHFEKYQDKLEASQVIEEAAKATEQKLTRTNTPEKRDSIESRAADLRQQSIREWQDAQMELTMAKQVDPDIAEKMKQRAPGTSAPLKAATPEVAKTESPKHPSVANEKGRAEEPARLVVEPEQAPVAEILDSANEDFPKYLEVKKEILARQTETVDIFIQGIRLNKDADSIKTIEMRYRDQAVVAKDKKEKSRLEDKADSLAMEADILTSRSKTLMAAAQKNTGKVNDLTAKSEQLKEKLLITPKPVGTDEPLAVKEKAEQAMPEDAERGNLDASVSSDTVLSASTERPIQSESGNTAQENMAGEERANVREQKTQQTEMPEENSAAAIPTNTTADSESSGGESAVSPAGSLNAGKSSPNPSDSTTVESNVRKDGTGKNRVPAGNAIQGEDEISYIPEMTSKETLSPEPDAKKLKVDLKQYERPFIESKTSELPADAELKFITEIKAPNAFNLSKSQPYTSTNPIPMDPSLPEGLVFKVQIGAFRKPLPANAFNNLQPLTGETSRPGWIRYCLGLFRSFEPANLLKKEVRGMGYPDAFVVAYYNGKRIPLYEAYTLISKSNAAAKQTYASIAESEFNRLEKFEIKKSSYSDAPDADENAFFGNASRIPVEKTEYSVQVGVYKTDNAPSALSSLQPLTTEAMSSGRYRFTTGRFDNRASADSMKRIAVNAGVKDAFVVPYRAGMKSATTSTATSLASSIAPNPTAATAPAQPEAAADQGSSTPEGLTGQEKIWFKVQIGAFRESIPLNKVTAFLQVAGMGITQETDARGLHLFYIGRYTSLADAASAREEILSKGINDAFIVGFVDGRRTTASEAQELLNRK